MYTLRTHRWHPLVFHIISVAEEKGHWRIKGATIRSLLFQTHNQQQLSRDKHFAPWSTSPSSIEVLRACWGRRKIRENEIWRVLVRQFALGTLSMALIPFSTRLWDVVYPRLVNTPSPLPPRRALLKHAWVYEPGMYHWRPSGPFKVVEYLKAKWDHLSRIKLQGFPSSV